MTPEQRSRMLEFGVSFDVETFRIQPGLLAPPLVCGSIAAWDGTKVVGEILDKEATLLAFRQLIEDPLRIIVGANISFDLLVCAVEWARRGVDLMPAIFRALEDQRIYDILIGEALNAIADGMLGKDPRTGGDLRDPITGETKNRYSLAIATDLTLDRCDAKANDSWRERYYDLRDIPIEQWPQPARDYPVDDAINSHLVALAQCGFLPKRAEHRWHDLNGKTRCERCLEELTFSGPSKGCRVTQRHQNLHSMSDQVYTAWCLHLGAAWGFNVDQASVDAIEKEVTEKRAALAVPLLAAGLLKEIKAAGEESIGRDTGAIARTLAIAYGAHGACETCGGSAKVNSPKAPMVRCKACKHTGVAATGGACVACEGRGKVVSEKYKINCQVCRSTGLDLATAPQLPCTDPSDKFPQGQVQATRDVLYESGDETLAELAEWLEDAKVIQTYIPYLRRARVECTGPDGTVYYKNRPLTLKPNVMLETDRVSYSDSIQQFPRKGKLRSCIRARAGYLFVSADWNMGESLTHAASCRRFFGYSDLGDALNKGLDPHASLAARVLNVTYEEFIARKKEKRFSDMRQAAKPVTFGRPASMGTIKIAMTQRKQGPDTPCEKGPAMISVGKDDSGKDILVRGFKGLRFCIVMDGAPTCGTKKVTQWGRPGYERDCPPICEHCLQCVDRICDYWTGLWRENKPYAKWASECSENGQPITAAMAEFLGVEGRRLAPGQVLQHNSAIVRGAVGYSDACNSWFQSLLGHSAKIALRIAQRECCDSSAIVPSDACAGGVASAYAGQSSPLLGSRCVVLQHDELLAELITSKAHDAATRLSEIMVRVLQETCPEQAPAVKAPAALMAVWLKNAEPKHSAEGRLIPWE